MQNATFCSKESGKMVDLELNAYKEEIAMLLAPLAVALEEQMSESFHVYEIGAFDRCAEYSVKQCQIVQNNLIL